MFDRPLVLLVANVNVVQPHVQHIATFLETIYLDDESADSVIASGCGLIG